MGKKILFTLALFGLLFSGINAQMKSGSFVFNSETPGYMLHSGDGLRSIEKDIVFDKPFDSKPKVRMAITMLDSKNESQTRYSVGAIAVTREGFTIKASVWNDTKFNAIAGNWFAEAEPLKLVKEEIKVGSVVQLNNISFEYNKATLKSQSYQELNVVAKFLNDNNTIEIEVAGHTDDIGSDKYNLKLSQERAEAVVEYLKGQGVAANRLSAKGYGETKPTASNATDSGREENRRVEFTVLKK